MLFVVVLMLDFVDGLLPTWVPWPNGGGLRDGGDIRASRGWMDIFKHFLISGLNGLAHVCARSHGVCIRSTSRATSHVRVATVPAQSQTLRALIAGVARSWRWREEVALPKLPSVVGVLQRWSSDALMNDAQSHFGHNLAVTPDLLASDRMVMGG